MMQAKDVNSTLGYPGAMVAAIRANGGVVTSASTAVAADFLTDEEEGLIADDGAATAMVMVMMVLACCFIGVSVVVITMLACRGQRKKTGDDDAPVASPITVPGVHLPPQMASPMPRTASGAPPLDPQLFHPVAPHTSSPPLPQLQAYPAYDDGDMFNPHGCVRTCPFLQPHSK